MSQRNKIDDDFSDNPGTNMRILGLIYMNVGLCYFRSYSEAKIRHGINDAFRRNQIATIIVERSKTSRCINFDRN